jgi:hypothetical protein
MVEGVVHRVAGAIKCFFVGAHSSAGSYGHVSTVQVLFLSFLNAILMRYSLRILRSSTHL